VVFPVNSGKGILAGKKFTLQKSEFTLQMKVIRSKFSPLCYLKKALQKAL
jgi:hypothetical protein